MMNELILKNLAKLCYLFKKNYKTFITYPGDRIKILLSKLDKTTVVSKAKIPEGKK